MNERDVDALERAGRVPDYASGAPRLSTACELDRCGRCPFTAGACGCSCHEDVED